MFEIRDMYVQVETQGDYCAGATIGDIRNKLGKEPNVHVIWNLDRDAFAKLIIDACASYGEVR